MAGPYFGGRTVVEIASESRYGVDPGGSDQVPIYGEIVPSIEASIEQLSRSQSGYGLSGIRQAFANRKVPPLRTYVCGSGSAEVPPVWMTLFDGSGMARSGDPTDAGRAAWRSCSAPHKSITVRQYIGGKKYVASGCRGGWSLDGEAGKQVPITFDFRAPYQESEACDLPVGEATPDAPPKLCNAGFVISPQGEDDITPKLQAIRITNDIGLVGLTASRASGGVSEFRKESSKITWSVVIEYDSSIDWESWFLQEIPKCFNLTTTVGQNVGSRVRFRTYRPYRAQLIQEPQHSTGANGIFLTNLVFGIRGRSDDEIEIVHE